MTPAMHADRASSRRARSATSSRASRTSPRSRSATRSRRRRPAPSEPLPGYLDVKPMVFAGLFPTDADQYPDLRDALEKLKLNDASLHYEPETSQALGFGFRCGFLGPAAHGGDPRAAGARVRPRPARDHAQRGLRGDAPSRARRVEVHNPSQMPDANAIEELDEPYVKASVIVPKEYVGTIMELVAGAPRRVRPHGVPERDARASSSTSCRWPRSCSTSTTS